ncbi:glutathione S-transferase N-terminal domain-containing protein [Inquilinus limosus]|uniref:Glutathione S-transferase n=1 Tax=Inquilinus limosus MP06 TaxID=1398085 RepID=A0A0A0D1A2_9PROT|nr:glutathione S-transferase N-terminal domain-containing protein [Inquilinus limosus]KGM31668.1 glutathione S-transferase [Inquilinus limosus MP06]
MKLYLAPGACSLADHIALHEAGLEFERIRVDIPTRRTESGDDFTAVNPKGYVPALVLDDGTVLTENAAILTWVAQRAPHLAPGGEMGWIRLAEMLSFIGAELHKLLIRSIFPTSDQEKQVVDEVVAQRLDYLAERLPGDYLFGAEMSVADAYLYVMLRWARDLKLPRPDPLPAYFDRVNARPAVQLALRHEGLS